MINEKFIQEQGDHSLDGPSLTLPVWMERGTRNAAKLMHMPLQQYVTVALCMQNLVVLATDDKGDDLI